MKVLIISHNPVSNQSNMGKTFLSLFSEFKTEELCQIYIYPTLPNEQTCASYYRVTDKQVLKALPRFGRPGGEILPEQIDAGQGMFESGGDESLYRSRKNKSAVRRLLRDLMWKLSRWNHAGLKAWLDEQAPDCIFVAPGVAKFIYDIALTIARERGLPIVTYICDEYYFVRRPDGALDRVRLKLLKSKIEALMRASAHLVTISEELKEHYTQRFGVPADVLMTGAAFPAAECPGMTDMPKTISYFGNVRCNRYVSLGEIGRALDQLNEESGEDYRLKIYSAERDPEILSHLSRYSSIELCGFVSGDAFMEALLHSELLLHTEAFDEGSIDFVQHSVSTKIADSLASGIPLLAYGPPEISSMLHLRRNECALVATSGEELVPMLKAAFGDAELRSRVVSRALQTAAVYHDSRATSARLEEILRHAANGDEVQ